MSIALPFKISYTIEEGDHAVDPAEVERDIREAIETWLTPLREYIGDDADKIVTASDIVLVNETGSYKYTGRLASRKEEAGKLESLTVVHILQRRGGFIVPYYGDEGARADVYLYAGYINDKSESGKGQRITTHEFGHMFELDDTYRYTYSDRTCVQDEKNREYYASMYPNEEQPYSADQRMFNRHTGKLHPPSIMQHCTEVLDDSYPGLLSPDDVCGIVEVYADRHLAKNGTKRRDLYRKMQNKLMQQYGFECVWSL